MKDIVILGRGASLEKLKGFESACSVVILVNQFWRTHLSPTDYFKDPVIASFLKGKDICLISNPSGSGEHDSSELEAAHTVVGKHNCVWPIGSKVDREWPPLGGWSSMPSDCVETYRDVHLSGKLKSHDLKNVGPVRGSLGYAILLAISHYKSDNIHIFGLDFYEADYYVPQNHNYELEKSQSFSIKEDFTTLFRHFDHITFTVHTVANYKPKLFNVNIK
jgi:hypothetical protein